MAPVDAHALLQLWSELPPDPAAAAECFGRFYTDPVVVNGEPLSLIELVARARVMQAALAEATREVLAVSSSDDTLALAFRMSGRHVGTLPTPIGDIQPSGRTLTLRVIDILILRGGRIAEVHMVADFAGALAALRPTTRAAATHPFTPQRPPDE